MKRFDWFVMGLCMMFLVPTLSVVAEAPGFQNLRFNEDWSNFDKTESDHWAAPIKKIGLSENVWLSVGGEQRFRYESWDNFAFGDANDDGYLLSRTQLHTDFHFGDKFRVFMEGRFNSLTDRELPGGKRAGLDIDEFDFGNAFFEANLGLADTKVLLRGGRQELQYGKQRLVSPLDWANNRRLFDGGLVSVKGEKYKADIFVTFPVTVDPDAFSWNDTNDDLMFSGIYYNRTLSKKTSLDAYFLARNFRHGAGLEEDRYTVGGRYYGRINDNFSFDIEAAYQFGEQEATDTDISAWAFTLEGTYAFPEVSWKPSITLGIDYASGDDSPTDGDVNTFSHMFPLAHAYLGFSDVTARQNVIDYRGTFAAWPIPGKLRLRADVHVMRLESEDDGLYLASGAPARPAAQEKDLGVAFDFTAMYKFNSRQNLLFGYSRFQAGDYISDTGPDENINFVYTQWGYQF